MRYTIEVPEECDPPDFKPLFDFIDSPESSEFLRQAECGELSFRSCFDELREFRALPEGAKSTVWGVVLSLYIRGAAAGGRDPIKFCARLAAETVRSLLGE